MIEQRARDKIDSKILTMSHNLRSLYDKLKSKNYGSISKEELESIIQYQERERETYEYIKSKLI